MYFFYPPDNHYLRTIDWGQNARHPRRNCLGYSLSETRKSHRREKKYSRPILRQLNRSTKPNPLVYLYESRRRFSVYMNQTLFVFQSSS